MKIIESQLPTGSVEYLAIGERYKELLDQSLKEKRIKPIWIKKNKALDVRVADHADLACLNLGGGKLCLSDHLLKSNKLISIINKIGYQYSSVPVDIYDSYLNICITGNHYIANKKSLSVDQNGIIPIIVKQQYARCSCCIVNKNSIITADHGIANAAIKNGIDVLIIEPGHIELDGFPYGFIGGASFKISKNEIAFAGDLKTHPDYLKIIEFLEKKEQKAVFLCSGKLKDIGSAILLSQY